MTPRSGASGLDALDEALRHDSARHLGVAAVTLTRVSLVERPASYVGRYLVRAVPPSDARCGLYVKVFKPRDNPGGLDAMRARVQHEFDTLQRMQTVFHGRPSLGVVPPVACYPESLAIATEEVAGPTLLDYLPPRMAVWASRAARLEAAQVLSQCGTFLRMLHDVEPHGPMGTAADIASYVDVRLIRLEREGGPLFNSPWRSRVLAHIECLAQQLSADDLVPRLAHADLALANVLVSDDRIVVLDFAMARQALRLLDVTRLSLQLDLLAVKPHISGATVRHLQSALREGFEPGLSDAHPLYRLLTLLHRVNHLGTLTLKPARFPETLYNGAVARAHRRWIAAELDRGAGL